MNRSSNGSTRWHPGKTDLFAILVLCVTSSFACAGSKRSEPQPQPQPQPAPVETPPSVNCGRVQPFDSDGDGISNPVERNNSINSYADLQTGRCDDDPSSPQGVPNKGKLIGGLNLPDKGTGYFHFRGTDGVDKDDWGSLTLLTCLESVGRALRAEGIVLNVGDLSLRGGGRFPPHASHQNGMDVDLRYVRRDRRSAPLDLRSDSAAYDPVATKKMFDIFLRFCPVRLIFVDTDRVNFPLDDDRIFHADGHSNHAHVRLQGAQP